MGEIVAVEVAGAEAVTASDRVAILLPVESLAPDALGAHLAPLGSELATAVGALVARPGFVGRFEQTAVGDWQGRGLVVSGLGPGAALEGRKLDRLTDGVVRAADAAGSQRLTIVMPALASARGQAAASRLLRVAGLASYRFDHWRGDAGARSLRAVTMVPPPGDEAEWRAAAATATAVAQATAASRDLCNEPPNLATPSWMAAQAVALAAAVGAEATVLDEVELAARGMGGILAVGGGSQHRPRMVRLTWGHRGPAVALVGKGVTFDTGGISIKPAREMEEMKYDKAGACTVLGVVRATAALDLPVRLSAYLPFAENMLDGASYRPGDIVRCHGGTTVEIHNTDAEGRMLLADALAWASADRPDALLEYSTLTGACVVALGLGGAGLFTPDDGLATDLLTAAGAAGERLWRLPMWSEMGEEMEGIHADLRNSGGRWGGASTAAAFLARFVTGVSRWAHLDIAGPAYFGTDAKPYSGATGFGIATTVGWLTAAGG